MALTVYERENCGGELKYVKMYLRRLQNEFYSISAVFSRVHLLHPVRNLAQRSDFGFLVHIFLSVIIAERLAEEGHTEVFPQQPLATRHHLHYLSVRLG